jgi:hypothetical protein
MLALWQATIPGGWHEIPDVGPYAVLLSGTDTSYVVLQLRTQAGLAGYGDSKELSRVDPKA